LEIVHCITTDDIYSRVCTVHNNSPVQQYISSQLFRTLLNYNTLCLIMTLWYVIISETVPNQ